MFEEDKKLWSRFAAAALTGCVSTLEERIDSWNENVDNPEDKITDEYDQIKEDCGFAGQYADMMLDLFHEKFQNC